MVDQSDRSGASERAGDDTPPAADLPERSAASPPPSLSDQTATTATRPRQVAGHYPMRQVTYYQFSTSDIRSVGVAQAAATICAALGTFALSIYIDFNKDLALAGAGEKPPPEFLDTVVNLSFWAWLVFWAIALFAFVWQGFELMRIKEEHQEPTIRTRLWAWCKKRGTR